MTSQGGSQTRDHVRFDAATRQIGLVQSEAGRSASLFSKIFAVDVLPAEMRAAAARRLGTVALFIAISFVAIFGAFIAASDLEIQDQRLVSIYGSLSIRVLPLVINFTTITFSIVLFFLTRRKGACPERLLQLGVFYQFIVALSIAILTHFRSWQGVEHVPGWPGVGVWIILFAVLVPSRPRRVLIVSFLVALMDPFGLYVTHLFGAPLPAPRLMIMFYTPLALAVASAVVCSVILHRLGRDIEKARRLGSYQLVERLGRGGMGEVWLAEHQALARPAAIKLIRNESLDVGDTDAQHVLVSRFEREAQATAMLESQHTVTLYDFGVTSDGCFYYVMELLRGMDLEQLVEQFGVLPPERVVFLLLQACHSLEEAHKRGLVHRDIKPANIYVSHKGLDADFAKVLDFGLVKRETGPAFGVRDESKLTVDGSVTGTPHYIAPEMIVGDEIDGRADIYCLGCVAYFALSGESVFGGEGEKLFRVLMRHVSEDPEPLSSRVPNPIPAELEALVHECLAKEPDERPASIGVVRERLGAVLFDSPWTQKRATEWWELNAPERMSGRTTADLPTFISADADTMLGLESKKAK